MQTTPRLATLLAAALLAACGGGGNDSPAPVACTDLTTRPWVQAAGVGVLDQPFFARGNVATAGGCLASQYLAAWIIARTEGIEAARSAIHYVAPVGEKDDHVARAIGNVAAYLPDSGAPFA